MFLDTEISIHSARSGRKCQLTLWHAAIQCCGRQANLVRMNHFGFEDTRWDVERHGYTKSAPLHPSVFDSDTT
jgi:hypothetical protein